MPSVGSSLDLRKSNKKSKMKQNMQNSLTAPHKIQKNAIVSPQRIDFEDTKEEIHKKERVSYVPKSNKVAPATGVSEPADSGLI